MATIKIDDDFDLKKIAESGQCFRPREIRAGLYRFITKENILFIRQLDEKHFEISCDPLEWSGIWETYFDLDTNYAKIRRDIAEFAAGKPYEKILTDAAEFGKGIRILRQDPFETLISFIISQRKNIPSIRKSVELICDAFGKIIRTDYGSVRTFPDYFKLSDASIMDLSSFALGYRSKYVRDAIDKVNNMSVNLDNLKSVSNETLIKTLQQINGVGIKVACCVALYAYHRTDVLPIDVWIQRAIEEDFGGENIFKDFGYNAGVLQQYIFFHKRLGEKEF